AHDTKRIDTTTQRIARPEISWCRSNQIRVPSDLKPVHTNTHIHTQYRKDAVGTRLPNLPHRAGIRDAQHKDPLESAKSDGFPLWCCGRHSRSRILQRLLILFPLLFPDRRLVLRSPNRPRIDNSRFAVAEHKPLFQGTIGRMDEWVVWRAPWLHPHLDFILRHREGITGGNG
ncbi:hypothetical protein CI238_00670, partial [Colletotrichum incanum]